MVTIKVMLGQQGKDGKRLTVIWKKLPLDTLFSSTQAPLLFRFNSTVRFQESNHAFMVWADSSHKVISLVPLAWGFGLFLWSFLPFLSICFPLSDLDSDKNSDSDCPSDSVSISFTQTSALLCLPSLSSIPLLYFEGSFASLFKYTANFFEIFFKGQTLIQKRIHVNCNINEIWGNIQFP